MITKLFEVRDEGTTFPLLAIQFKRSESDESVMELRERERWLLYRAGYGKTEDAQEDYILVCDFNVGGSQVCSTNCLDFAKAGDRTLKIASYHIGQRWERLKSGDIIDVQYILRETAAPKESEMPRVFA